MSNQPPRRRGRLARLDDAVYGASGTKRGWYGDLVLGLHPLLVPFYVVVVLVGVGLVVYAGASGEWGASVVGGGWVIGGSAYAWASRGKRRAPQR